MESMSDQRVVGHYWNAIINLSLKLAEYAKDALHAGGRSSRAGTTGRKDGARNCSGRAR